MRRPFSLYCVYPALICFSFPSFRSQLTNLPEVVQQEVSSALEESEQPLLEEVCALRSTVEATLATNKAAVETMKPSVDAAKSSVENLVETVKSTVEDAVGRAVEDLQRSEAEGREELKRSVEEASVELLMYLNVKLRKASVYFKCLFVL